MKKKNLLTILVLIFSFTMFAENVPIEKAKKAALNFYYEKYNQYEGQLAYEQLSIRTVYIETDGVQNFYYVFQVNNKGFVIVPADDCLTPVLGYSFEHEYLSENQPPNVQYWLGQYKEQVVYAKTNKLIAEERIETLWLHFLNDDFHLSKKQRDEVVGPLLTSTWNQDMPYNYYCPYDSSLNKRTLVSCQATTIGQILYYWGWPESGKGTTSFYIKAHPEYGVQTADYENTNYCFREMVGAPKTTNTAIGELCYHAAAVFHTNFSTVSSAPDSIFILDNQSLCDTLSYHLKLLPSDILYRDSMPDADWREGLRAQLDAGYPIFYAGYRVYPSIGHFFVCDGYQNEEEYYHFNFGWSGDNDGYYTLDQLNNFEYSQFRISTIFPDTLQYEYPLYKSGADTLKMVEGSITDGSGPIHNYLNNTQVSWLIDPQNEVDSVTNITLEIKKCGIAGGDYLKIYDGADNTAPLLAAISGDDFPESIESAGNRVFVEFTSNAENTGAGFLLNYSSKLPVFCSGMDVVNDSIKRLNDGSGRFYYQNNRTCIWRIEPEGCDSSLTLFFDYFDTEAEYDFLQILDLEAQEVIAEYSGHFNEPPPPVVSPSGKIMLLFNTNSSIRGKGWSVYYGDFTGIETQSEPIGLTIHPNPANHTLHLSFQSTSRVPAIVTIYNQLGQQIKNETLVKTSKGSNELSMDVASLEAGVYLLQLAVDGQVVTKKFVKY